jgi:hypothetical protein
MPYHRSSSSKNRTRQANRQHKWLKTGFNRLAHHFAAQGFERGGTGKQSTWDVAA